MPQSNLSRIASGIFTPWPVTLARWWRNPTANKRARRWVTLVLGYLILFLIVIPYGLWLIVGDRGKLAMAMRFATFVGSDLIVLTAILAILVSVGKYFVGFPKNKWWQKCLRFLVLGVEGTGLFLFTFFAILSTGLGPWRFAVLAVILGLTFFLWRQPTIKKIWVIWGRLAFLLLTIIFLIAASAYIATMIEQPWTKNEPLYPLF